MPLRRKNRQHQMSRDKRRVNPDTVIVTGSSGFIGQHVCRQLAGRGATVVGVDRVTPRQPVQWATETCDILDRDSLISVFKKYRPVALIHLAARCDLDGRVASDYPENDEGVRNVCRAVSEQPSCARAIFTSSQLVCGVGKLPATPTDFHPSTAYGASKVASEIAVRELDGGGAKWCITRPTTIWGPGMNDHYQNFLRHVGRGTYFHFGNAPLLKSYGYVKNSAYQYDELLRAPAERIHKNVFYIADYEPLSLVWYANRIALELGVRRPRHLPLVMAYALARIGDLLGSLGVRVSLDSFRLKNIMTSYVFNMDATEAVCGPLPYSATEGVHEMIRWYLSRSDAK